MGAEMDHQGLAAGRKWPHPRENAGRSEAGEPGLDPDPAEPPSGSSLLIGVLPAQPRGTFRGIKWKRKWLGGSWPRVSPAPTQKLITLRPSNYVCACSKRELRFKTKVKKVSLHTSRRTRHLNLKEGGVQQAPLPPGSIRGRGVRSVAGLTQGGLWPKTSIKVATWARGVPASES